MMLCWVCTAGLPRTYGSVGSACRCGVVLPIVLLMYLIFVPPPPHLQVGGRLRVLAEAQPLLLTWLKEEQGTSQRLAVRLRAASEDTAAKEQVMQVCVCVCAKGREPGRMLRRSRGGVRL